MADTFHESVLRNAASMAVAAALPDVPAERVYVRLTGDRAKITLPCVICTLEGVKETWVPLDTENDVLTLPVNVILCHRIDLRTDDVLLRKWLVWRQALRAAYLMQLMTDVPEVWHVDVEPMDTIDHQRLIGPEYQGGAAGVLLKPQVVVPRVRAA